MVIDYTVYYVLLLYSAAVGFFLGAVFDVFRIQRVSMAPSSELSPVRRKRRGQADGCGIPLCAGDTARPLDGIRFAIIFAEDVLFFLIAAVVVTVLVYQANFGRVRWFALLGVLAGFALWYNTVGRLTMLFSEYIIYFLRTAVKLAARAICRFVLSPVGRLCRGIWLASAGRIAKALRRSSTKAYKRKLLKLASTGFQAEKTHAGRRKAVEPASGRPEKPRRKMRKDEKVDQIQA